MNLHAVAAGIVGSVNPGQLVSIQQSEGYTTNPDGSRPPITAYLGGAAFTAALAAGIMTVTGAVVGAIAAGQTITGTGVTQPANILSQVSGTTYRVTGAQTLSAVAMVSSSLWAQVQELTTTDLRQLDALNIQGSTRVMYISGEVDAIARVRQKGGDLVTMIGGDGQVYLTTRVLEMWPDWCKVAVVLQDGS